MYSVNNTICLAKPDIFSFSECLHFLDRGYDDCLYSIEERHVLKPLTINDTPSLFQISEECDTLVIEVLSGDDSKNTLRQISRYVVDWFDMDRNLQPFYQLLEKDNRLLPMAEQYFGLRLMGIPDLFEALCWCVIGQQINLTFAHRIKRQLVETYGTFVTHKSKRHYLFPEPQVLAGLKVKDLKALQFSRQKAEYVIGIASQFANGSLSKQAIADLADTDAMLKRLKEIRGVGDWTANYALMKSMGRLNCITHGDTGLQSAVASILELDRKPTRKEIEAFFEPFAGWESYLNIYLWRTLS